MKFKNYLKENHKEMVTTLKNKLTGVEMKFLFGIVDEFYESNNFTSFYLNTNAFFAYIYNLDDLYVAYTNLTGQNGGLETLDDFLDKIQQHESGSLNFGSYGEHKGKRTLRDHLLDIDYLEQFEGFVKKKEECACGGNCACK